MRPNSLNERGRHFRQDATTVCFAIAIAIGMNSPTNAGEFEGFTEPFRTINVAADDSGTVEEVSVREGQKVDAGQTLAKLNSVVQHALLAIAEQSMNAEGRLDAARAELLLRKDRLEKLQPLRVEGHARQEEVDRAVAELAVAEANLRAAQEDAVAKRLEFEKIKTQIAFRTVRAPVAGVVAALHKEIGEYVAPNSPDVLTLVQIDRLLANFTLMQPQAEKLVLGQRIPVYFGASSPVAGVVEFISPVTNAESGTVLVKLLIENADAKLRSGQRCKIRIEE